ncbi:MAG: SufE family protein [Micrococcaceae bacterium]
MPPALEDIIEEFAPCSNQEKLEFLLEFSDELPELPARFLDDKNNTMEQVVECQSPLFLAVEEEDGIVKLYFSAPPEAPTTRGFASILAQGLAGLTPQEIAQLDENIPDKLGLKQAISPLRLRGMSAMISRIKRKAKELDG